MEEGRAVKVFKCQRSEIQLKPSRKNAAADRRVMRAERVSAGGGGLIVVASDFRLTEVIST